MLKRRAPKACIHCRNRKVRCDVSRTGIPCTNCSQAAGTCEVDDTRKRRLNAEPRERAVPASSIHTWELDDLVSVNPNVDSTGSKIPNSHQQQHQDGQNFDLPSYVCSIPSTLCPDELQLLNSQGALSLPSEVLLDELLRAYVRYVHCFLPLLDLGEFLNTIRGNTSLKISLPLLQAVLFAGVSFVDMSHLMAEGYQTRKDARKIFFRRVKLLYDADVEREPTTMIQVLLLMTYWYDQQNDSKGRFYWLRIALSLASDIGLDRVDDRGSQVPKSKPQIWRRRLWYCCIMRARLLSVSERRHTAMSTESLPDLCVDEIYEDALAEALTHLYGPMSEASARTLSQLCVQKIKLCQVIGRILDSQYELSGLRKINPKETFVVLIPKSLATHSDKSASWDHELREWYTETTSLQGALFGQDHRRNGQVVGVHSATLEMLYYTALSVTHRPQLLQQQPRASAGEALQEFSRQTLRHAARRITEIGRKLDESYLLRFLPPIAVGSFIVASVQHLKDAMNADADLRSTGQLYLNQTIEFLKGLDNIYNSAQCAMDYIGRVRSGELPYESFEWEERIHAPAPITIEHNKSDTSASDSNGGPDQDPQVLRPDETAESGKKNHGNAVESNSRKLDAISEIFLSTPFDANELDWTRLLSG